MPSQSTIVDSSPKVRALLAVFRQKAHRHCEQTLILGSHAFGLDAGDATKGACQCGNLFHSSLDDEGNDVFATFVVGDAHTATDDLAMVGECRLHLWDGIAVAYNNCNNASSVHDGSPLGKIKNTLLSRKG